MYLLGPSSRILEKFYGYIDLEFELDKKKGVCTLFECEKELDRFKAGVYKKVYNTLVEQTQENSNTI